MTIFWPSTHPSSRSLCRNASVRDGLSEGDVKLRKPIRGTFPAGCASTASGAAMRLTARMATSATPLIIMPPGSVAGERLERGGVQAAVGRERVAGGERVVAVEVGEPAAGFLDDDLRRGQVPDLEVQPQRDLHPAGGQPRVAHVVAEPA